MIKYNSKSADTKINSDIDLGDFWPALSVEQFRTQKRMPTDYDDTQVRAELVKSALIVMHELASWQTCQERDDKQSADECGYIVDGVGSAQILFINAVFDHAKASLLIHYKTLERRDEAASLAKEENETHAALLAASQDAIRAILGIGSSSVQLL